MGWALRKEKRGTYVCMCMCVCVERDVRGIAIQGAPNSNVRSLFLVVNRA